LAEISLRQIAFKSKLTWESNTSDIFNVRDHECDVNISGCLNSYYNLIVWNAVKWMAVCGIIVYDNVAMDVVTWYAQSNKMLLFNLLKYSFYLLYW